MRLDTAARAVREIERCARWWRANRRLAPDLFEQDLARALEQIRTAPGLGAIYEATPRREHRRIPMPRTRYHVYYRILAPDHVLVVSVWSAVRGRGPAL